MTDAIRYPSMAVDDRPFRLKMALRKLADDGSDWLEVDAERAAELALKRDLLAHRHEDVFAALPGAGTEEAGAEVLEEVRRWGAAAEVAMDDELLAGAPAGAHPLDLAGRLVQEDLCLHTVVDGRIVLSAASLCFPQRWRLADKLGRPMRAIHAPVNRYTTDLADAVDGYLERLTAGPGVWRLNWALHDDPALFQPGGHSRDDVNETITPQRAGEQLYLRVERQTLRRLPQTGAVLFTIRTYRWTVQEIVTADSSFAGLLAHGIRALPPETFHYKSLTPFAPPLLAWLDERAIPAGGT